MGFDRHRTVSAFHLRDPPAFYPRAGHSLTNLTPISTQWEKLSHSSVLQIQAALVSEEINLVRVQQELLVQNIFLLQAKEVRKHLNEKIKIIQLEYFSTYFKCLAPQLAISTLLRTNAESWRLTKSSGNSQEVDGIAKT